MASAANCAGVQFFTILWLALSAHRQGLGCAGAHPVLHRPAWGGQDQPRTLHCRSVMLCGRAGMTFRPCAPPMCARRPAFAVALARILLQQARTKKPHFRPATSFPLTACAPPAALPSPPVPCRGAGPPVPAHQPGWRAGRGGGPGAPPHLHRRHARSALPPTGIVPSLWSCPCAF